ncbi:Ig-like domain-containing protein [Mangrovibacterium sp.]|uniref:Ig-like domain-containing protein n=1 Tax=Mangrovibacterium sp. TaxID=1961364 RepID=UPI003564EF77
MSTIINTYPVFESNQVLTSKQMNSLVSYLEQQTRLTRAKLIGMGVVCGLNVSYNTTTNELTISKGTGITSEGFLMALGDCVTVKHRPYKLPPGTIYEPFVDSANLQDVTLYELLTENADDGAGVVPLNDDTFLADKVVLLFIERFDKDLKSCLGKSCDELGKERSLTIRKLLISVADLQKVWDRTNTGKLDAVFPEKYNLPTINLPRALFDPAALHSSDFTEFSKHYANVVLSVFDNLIEALSETFNIYRPLLLDSYQEQNPFETDPLLEKISEIHNLLDDANPTYNSYVGIQYVYDLVVDLILAYHEFKNSAFDLLSECSADMTRFPKHLMLGNAMGDENTLCEQSEYRHHFVQPPVYNGQKLLIKKVISLHNRMVLMLESFDIERINGLGEIAHPIRITPSLEKRTCLSGRSIPWYYDLNVESFYAGLGNLRDYWNYDINRKCPFEEDGLVLNYEDQADDQTVVESKLYTPLYYDLQDYSYFRIEGYTNKSATDAIRTITNLKKQFNLPFDLIALQLKAETLQLDYRCGFDDLQDEYRFARTGLCGIIHDLRQLYKYVADNQEGLFDPDRQEDVQEILEHVKELLAMLMALCDHLSECIQDFDFQKFQDVYKSVLQYTIDFILVDQDLLNEITIKKGEEKKQVPLINGAIQRLFPLAHKFVDLLFFLKFYRIYYAFKRREFYLRKETLSFSNFIQKHPGIDHQAGVRKGGTFILVSRDSDDSTVVADFNLPYICCGKDSCVPMCDDSEFVPDMAPFARPDYAVTTTGVPVDINVSLNDYQLFGGEFVVEADNNSAFGGTVTQITEDGLLGYQPKIDFVGVDTFNYTLKSNKNGQVDKAKVTIRVKNPDSEVKPCYSVPILQCWGEDAVLQSLKDRGFNLSGNEDFYQLLLDSLRQTVGFSNDEINGGVLEGLERRQQLLTCLGIAYSDNTSYDQLGELIVAYQNNNCGKAVQDCFGREIFEKWGNERAQKFLSSINLDPGQDAVGRLLDYLKANKGFSQEEMDLLIDTEMMMPLLLILFPNLSTDFINPTQMKEMLTNYQIEHCN